MEIGQMRFTDGICKCVTQKEFPKDVWCWSGVTDSNDEDRSYTISMGGYGYYGGPQVTCNSGEEYCLQNLDIETSTTMCESMFKWETNLISLDLSNFDTSNITDMNSMFYGCEKLMSLDVSHFDTSNVTDMAYMFDSCSSLTTLNVSHFNTSSAISMDAMFDDCCSLESLDLSNFDTSNVTSMSYMFGGCTSLTSLDLSNFNTSAVTSMGSMFGGCSSLTSLDLSHFNISNVTDMSYMFLWRNDNLEIKCKKAFRNWCITNADTIYLPTTLNNVNSSQWIIID